MKKRMLIIAGVYTFGALVYTCFALGLGSIEIFGISILNVVVCMAIGAVISGVYVSKLVKEMNNVQNQSAASNYTVVGSFRLDAQSDKFLFSNTNKFAKAQKNGSNRSHSRGSSRGGGGRSRGRTTRRSGGGRRKGGGRRR